MPGKVYLVGAGPGHPQLLTIKALELLRTADVVIYDRLIPEEILALARADAERIYVGKAPGRHESRQQATNDVLVEAAHRAARVVRLKGGDPTLFGRGGEEAAHLAAHGIPFEIVPGVTAALSVPMAAGIPVTHRDCASSVAIVTGHRRDDRELRELDWAALAGIDTVIFLMGVHKLPEIAQRLMANGRAPTTPAAVVQMAYWPGEQAVVGTLRDLPRLAEEASVIPPATIVVGEVVRLRDRLTTLDRELRRDSGEPARFGLSVDELIARLGSMARAGADVRAALELQLFDDLEDAVTAEELARRRGLDARPLRELLARLARLGLFLREEDSFRNSEVVSLQLRGGAEVQRRLLAELAEAASYDPLSLLKPPAV